MKFQHAAARRQLQGAPAHQAAGVDNPIANFLRGTLDCHARSAIMPMQVPKTKAHPLPWVGFLLPEYV